MTLVARLRFASRAACVLLLLAAAGRAAGAPPRVVASIVPVHSLVAAVMEGVASPDLLLPGGVSPHTYALRPSDMERLERADLVVWVGEALERFLLKALQPVPGRTRRVLALMDSDGVTLHRARDGGVFQRDGAGGAAASIPPPAHGEHAHGHGPDPHLWLDPDNAVAIVHVLARELAALDADNAPRYAANAQAAAARVRALQVEIAARLAPVRERAYVVFHDAYQGFEQHFGLRPAAAVSVTPERAPGAKRLVEIRERIRDTGARCVFSEPQFEPRLVDVLLEGTGARRAVLDPIGSGLTPGPRAWFDLMRNLGLSLSQCLSDS